MIIIRKHCLDKFMISEQVMYLRYFMPGELLNSYY
jgi:hypothetical protein